MTINHPLVFIDFKRIAPHMADDADYLELRRTGAHPHMLSELSPFTYEHRELDASIVIGYPFNSDLVKIAGIEQRVHILLKYLRIEQVTLLRVESSHNRTTRNIVVSCDLERT